MPEITREEVMGYLSAVMRGESQPDGEPPTPAQRMKAAELLARHFGLLAPEKAAGFCAPDALREISEALEREKEAGFTD